MIGIMSGIMQDRAARAAERQAKKIEAFRDAEMDRIADEVCDGVENRIINGDPERVTCFGASGLVTRQRFNGGERLRVFSDLNPGGENAKALWLQQIGRATRPQPDNSWEGLKLQARDRSRKTAMRAALDAHQQYACRKTAKLNKRLNKRRAEIIDAVNARFRP